MRAFGEQIGIAFQLSDDLLDIASDSAESGKTPGTDLREGVATLPALYALRGDRRVVAAAARTGRADRCPTTTSTPRRCDLLRASTALDEARATATAYADRARAMLVDLPDVPARAALAALCDLVVARTG